MESGNPLSDDDKTALLALVARYVRLWDRRQEDLKIKAEVEARIAEQTEQFEKMASAFGIFGFNSKTDAFVKIREVVGSDVYDAALDRARVSESAPRLLLEHEPSTLKADLPGEGEPTTSGDSTPTVRDLVLESLKAAGEKGRKAAEIQAQIEARRGEKLHPKTCGMTLYRLLKDGLARRDKRTWFFVPPKADTKNPGAVTPGLIDRSN